MLFVSGIIFLYILFLAALIYFWKRKEIVVPYPSEEQDFISVIVPVRDEPELHLLIEDLSSQSLAREHYEIIVVDDHSDPKVTALGDDVKILTQEISQSGKKDALTKGINEAKGNIIVTLDSDCRIKKGFLKKIYYLFRNYDVVLSPGLIEYNPAKNIFERMQAMETVAIMGTGVALHRMGNTSLSNGANLAFKKIIWQKTGGYSKHRHTASGDDELFVQHIAALYPEQIVFRTSDKSVVSTKPNHSFQSFFYQRLRWAGKWRKYENVKMKIIAFKVFLFHLMICAGLILLFETGAAVLVTLFLAKLLVEGYLIYNVCKKTKSPFFPGSIIILQVLYSPYVVFFGIVSNFIPYKWKGRRYYH